MSERILIIESGHSSSTSDVCTGLVAGLRAQGCDVHVYPLGNVLAINDKLKALGEEHAPQLTAGFDPYAVASMAILGWCVWKEPNAVIAVTGSQVHHMTIMSLRKLGIPCALLCTESPYQTTAREQHDAAVYDHVFTNERQAIPLFGRSDPARVHYLPHAYNPDVHLPGPVEADKVCDAFFVGTGFLERRVLFGGVDWTGVDFRCLGTLWKGEASAAEMLAPVVENEEAARWYRSAKISLNHHRTTADYHERTAIDASLASSLGPRAYEIAACGAFQLCDNSREELHEVFQGSVPTYAAGDSADLGRAVRYWLAHPDERERRQREQHEAVLPHSWTDRAWQILSVVLNSGAAGNGATYGGNDCSAILVDQARRHEVAAG